jgi:hypothetical protein
MMLLRPEKYTTARCWHFPSIIAEAKDEAHFPPFSVMCAIHSTLIGKQMQTDTTLQKCSR